VIRQLLHMRCLWRDASVTLHDIPSGDGIEVHTLTNFLHVFGQCKEVRWQVCPHILRDTPNGFHDDNFLRWIIMVDRVSRFVFFEGDYLMYVLIISLYEFARDSQVAPSHPISIYVDTPLIYWDLDDDEFEMLEQGIPRVFVNESRTCLFRLHASIKHRDGGVTADLIPWQ
jgi:hypothetical protein